VRLESGHLVPHWFEPGPASLILSGGWVPFMASFAHEHVSCGHGPWVYGQVFVGQLLCLTATHHNSRRPPISHHRGGITAARRMSDSFLLLIHL